MPELPEVENQVRGLQAIVGKKILVVWTSATPRFFGATEGLLHKVVPQQKVVTVARRGKHIVITLSKNVLLAHLGMTGHFLVTQPTNTREWWQHSDRFVRVALRLSGGQVAYFSDIRKFGHLYCYTPKQAKRYLGQLGVEPLAVSAADFTKELRRRRGAIKPLLLGQKVVAGLGNIYVDESLFLARIHPRQSSEKLSTRQVVELHRVMQQVLQRSIAAGGSSFRDFVNVQARKGRYQKEFLVYSNKGRPCPRDAKHGAITKIVVATRGTHLCTTCQPIHQ